MDHEKNYSIRNYVIAGVAGAALITTGIIVGIKIHKRHVEDYLETHYKNLANNEKD